MSDLVYICDNALRNWSLIPCEFLDKHIKGSGAIDCLCQKEKIRCCNRRQNPNGYSVVLLMVYSESKFYNYQGDICGVSKLFSYPMQCGYQRPRSFMIAFCFLKLLQG